MSKGTLLITQYTIFSPRRRLYEPEAQNPLFHHSILLDIVDEHMNDSILLDIVDEHMNDSSYAQCATHQYLKTVQFSSVNLEP
jgi:hypothetical protein